MQRCHVGYANEVDYMYFNIHECTYTAYAESLVTIIRVHQKHM